MSDLPNVVDEHIRRVEGGFQNDPDDPGNWTGGRVGEGTLRGTKWGISAAANPDVDIENLTWEQAEDLYFDRYWKPSGSAEMWDRGDQGLALVTMDASLHSGISRGTEWTEQAEGDPMEAISLRLEYLTDLDRLWPRYNRGWTRRIARLMDLVACLERPKEGANVVDLLIDNRPLRERIRAAIRGTSGPVAYRVRPLQTEEGSKLDIRSA